MNLLKKVYCRMFQAAFRLAMPVLPYRQPELFYSVEQIIPMLMKKKIHSVLMVTDEVLRGAGVTRHLEELLEKNGIKCTVYDKTRPNPTVHNVEAARLQYRANNCQCLIAFGGGSSMDCAKAVGARIAYPKKTLDQMKGLLRVWRRLPLLREPITKQEKICCMRHTLPVFPLPNLM